MEIIMKAIYQKPAIKDDEFSLEAIMVTASNGGQTILGNGGNTSDNNITEGDSRAWDWGDDDDDF